MNGCLLGGERERKRESQLADKSQQRTAVPLHHIQLGYYSYSSFIKSESFIISAITIQHDLSKALRTIFLLYIYLLHIYLICRNTLKSVTWIHLNTSYLNFLIHNMYGISTISYYIYIKKTSQCTYCLKWCSLPSPPQTQANCREVKTVCQQRIGWQFIINYIAVK